MIITSQWGKDGVWEWQGDSWSIRFNLPTTTHIFGYSEGLSHLVGAQAAASNTPRWIEGFYLSNLFSWTVEINTSLVYYIGALIYCRTCTYCRNLQYISSLALPNKDTPTSFRRGTSSVILTVLVVLDVVKSDLLSSGVNGIHRRTIVIQGPLWSNQTLTGSRQNGPNLYIQYQWITAYLTIN